jgi:transcription initiation factor TFIIIB Brf1 subunit/transcription initiation factor TFIIB
MERCPKCGSKNIIFNEKFAEWICRNCLRIYYLEDVIERKIEDESK